MTHHLSTQPFYRINMLAAPLLLAATVAHGQTAPSAPINQKTSTTARVVPAEFQSAVKDYKPYVDVKTSNWKEANDVTAKVGGWRAYAKEAAGEPDADPHAGHAKPTQGQPTSAQASQAKP